MALTETTGMTKEEKLDFWRLVIEDQEQSGLTVSQYCSANSINRGVFYRWERRLRDTLIMDTNDKYSITDTPEFVEIETDEESSSKINIPVVKKLRPITTDVNTESTLSIKIKDIDVVVSESTSMDLLEKVIKVLAYA